MTILEGSLEDGSHVFAAVLSRQPGIVYGDEWVDTLGMRGIQSGGISISNVVVSWVGRPRIRQQAVISPLALQHAQLAADPAGLHLVLPRIAEGALARALAYTKANTRGWPYQPTPVARVTDEAYIQIGYGDLQAKLWATASFIEKVYEEAKRCPPHQPSTGDHRGTARQVRRACRRRQDQRRRCRSGDHEPDLRV